VCGSLQGFCSLSYPFRHQNKIAALLTRAAGFRGGSYFQRM
jgi:hypothetical protein